MTKMALVHGLQVVAARAMLGLSQTDLAELSGVDLGAIHELERGEGERPEYAAIEAALLPLGIEFSQDQVSFGMRLARTVDGLTVSEFIRTTKAVNEREAARLAQSDRRLATTATRVAVLKLFDEFRADRSIRSSISGFLASETLARFVADRGQPLRLSNRTVLRWVHTRSKRGEGGLVRRYAGGRRGWYDVHLDMRQALIDLVKASGPVKTSQISAMMRSQFPDAAVRLGPRAIDRAIAALAAAGELTVTGASTGR